MPQESKTLYRKFTFALFGVASSTEASNCNQIKQITKLLGSQTFEYLIHSRKMHPTAIEPLIQQHTYQ